MLFYIVPIALAIYALADLVAYRDENPLGLPKGIWALIIIIFVLFGPIGWIVISRMSQPDRPARRPRNQGYAPPAPRAPDDDPEFLWRLAQQQRREREAAAEQEKKNPKTNPPTPEDPQTP